MKYCPIMTIGFAPPESNMPDPRKCRKDCAWYDENNESCFIVNIAEDLQHIKATTSDLVDLQLDQSLFYGYQDEV